jgi:hypothetical protein
VSRTVDVLHEAKTNYDRDGWYRSPEFTFCAQARRTPPCVCQAIPRAVGAECSSQFLADSPAARDNALDIQIRPIVEGEPATGGHRDPCPVRCVRRALLQRSDQHVLDLIEQD